MIAFTDAERDACCRLVDLAIAEDLGDRGDLTSQAVIPESARGRAAFIARFPGILAGMPAVELVLQRVDPYLRLVRTLNDGARITRGDVLGRLEGSMRSILAAERTALNFLQRLSGIATLTRRHVDELAGLPCLLLDTRKTTPGWRLLEKFAVRMGGGHNHRCGLFDGILIKDNHLAALEQGGDAVAEAIRRARARHGREVPLEIEVDTLEQLDAALAAGPDIVLLDNMQCDQLREAVARRNRVAPQVQLEASGGVTLATLRAIAETGVDRVSVGALTHSARALDIALDYEVG